MPHTKRTFPIQTFRILFSKFRARVIARSNFAVFLRTADSQACAAGSRSCQSRLLPKLKVGGDPRCTRSGIGVGVRSRTAWVIPFSAAPKRCIHQKAANKYTRLSIIT